MRISRPALLVSFGAAIVAALLLCLLSRTLIPLQSPRLPQYRPDSRRTSLSTDRHLPANQVNADRPTMRLPRTVEVANRHIEVSEWHVHVCDKRVTWYNVAHVRLPEVVWPCDVRIALTLQICGTEQTVPVLSTAASSKEQALSLVNAMGAPKLQVWELYASIDEFEATLKRLSDEVSAAYCQTDDRSCEEFDQSYIDKVQRDRAAIEKCFGTVPSTLTPPQTPPPAR